MCGLARCRRSSAAPRAAEESFGFWAFLLLNTMFREMLPIIKCSHTFPCVFLPPAPPYFSVGTRHTDVGIYGKTSRRPRAEQHICTGAGIHYPLISCGLGYKHAHYRHGYSLLTVLPYKSPGNVPIQARAFRKYLTRWVTFCQCTDTGAGIQNRLSFFVPTIRIYPYRMGTRPKNISLPQVAAGCHRANRQKGRQRPKIAPVLIFPCQTKAEREDTRIRTALPFFRVFSSYPTNLLFEQRFHYTDMDIHYKNMMAGMHKSSI